MRVFDAFTFFNELDLLEVRLHELDSAVDVFVLAEAPLTFRGGGKPLHFAEHRERFARFLPKIRHVVVDDMPAGDDPWLRERWQRNALRRGLADLAAEDLVMVSDLDEIPRASAVRVAATRTGFTYFETALFIYHLNWLAQDWPGPPWTRAYAASGGMFAALSDLNAPREATPDAFLGAERAAEAILRDAGWHFSYMGGAAAVTAKLLAFSHAEPEVQRWAEPSRVAERIAAKAHFVNGAALIPIALDARLPAFVRDNAATLRARGLIAD